MNKKVAKTTKRSDEFGMRSGTVKITSSSTAAADGLNQDNLRQKNVSNVAAAIVSGKFILMTGLL